jgi:hypothetical protein
MHDWRAKGPLGKQQQPNIKTFGSGRGGDRAEPPRGEMQSQSYSPVKGVNECLACAGTTLLVG